MPVHVLVIVGRELLLVEVNEIPPGVAALGKIIQRTDIAAELQKLDLYQSISDHGSSKAKDVGKALGSALRGAAVLPPGKPSGDPKRIFRHVSLQRFQDGAKSSQFTALAEAFRVWAYGKKMHGLIQAAPLISHYLEKNDPKGKFPQSNGAIYGAIYQGWWKGWWTIDDAVGYSLAIQLIGTDVPLAPRREPKLRKPVESIVRVERTFRTKGLQLQQEKPNGSINSKPLAIEFREWLVKNKRSGYMNIELVGREFMRETRPARKRDLKNSIYGFIHYGFTLGWWTIEETPGMDPTIYFDQEDTHRVA